MPCRFGRQAVRDNHLATSIAEYYLRTLTIPFLGKYDQALCKSWLLHGIYSAAVDKPDETYWLCDQICILMQSSRARYIWSNGIFILIDMVSEDFHRRFENSHPCYKLMEVLSVVCAEEKIDEWIESMQESANLYHQFLPSPVTFKTELRAWILQRCISIFVIDVQV